MVSGVKESDSKHSLPIVILSPVPDSFLTFTNPVGESFSEQGNEGIAARTSSHAEAAPRSAYAESGPDRSNYVSLCTFSIVRIGFAHALILRIISSFWIWVTKIRLRSKFNDSPPKFWV